MDMVALELIRNLQIIDHDNEYVIFVKPDEDSSTLIETPNFKIVRLNGGFYPWWEQFALPIAARKEKCDLLHCTSNTAPVFSNMPIIDTLHDIIYMEQSFSSILKGSGTPYQKFGNIYRKLIVPHIIRKSKKVITVSNFEMHRIAEFFGMAEDSRLTAVYNGVGEHFKTVTDKDELLRVKEKYQLPDQFFFFLGNTDPKKNTRGTLEAFVRFIKASGSDMQLVMLDYDRAELGKMLNDIGAHDFLDRIHLTGYVINSDLPAIYSQCSIFLYPSLRESFGIPILEAMGCGVPVITSNTSSMPEIAGEAAILIDPFKPDQITAAMIKIMDNQTLRNELASKGLERAALFSWKRMAEEVKTVYESVYSDMKKK